jgi:hypothetical protein
MTLFLLAASIGAGYFIGRTVCNALRACGVSL